MSLKSNLLFSWATDFLEKGSKKPHNLETLLKLKTIDLSNKTSEDFLKTYNHFKVNKHPLIRTLAKLHFKETIRSVLLVLIHVIFQTLTPMLLRSLVSVLEGKRLHWDPIAEMLPKDSLLAGIILAFSIFTSTLLVVFSIHHAFYGFLGVASRIKSSLTLAIYRKSLNLSREAKQDIPNGQIVNLMANDVNRLHMLLLYIHSPFCHPVQIVLVMTLLYLMLGWASLVGAFVMFSLLAMSVGFAKLNASLRKKLLKVSDKRISLINEILSHMRVIKLYGWEKSFLKEVADLRSLEVSFLSKIAMVGVAISSLFQAAPVLIAASTFTTFSILGSVPPLGDLFAAIGLYAILKWSLTTFPETIVLFFEVIISAKRIEDFFSLPEHRDAISTRKVEIGHMEMRNCSFNWSTDIPALKDISLTARPSQLTCIVGKIGSGKTALLLAILGELNKASGELALAGKIGYVSQHPWIVNDTIRNNIILGESIDEKRYKLCLKASALYEDLNLFPQGDSTEIGERGINLSGGQKQRVSLARALYANSDIYLFDDALSALDRSVREKVFTNLIRTELKSKTVIFVTHLLEFADRADQILVLDKGVVAESGSPGELNRPGSLYAELKAESERTSEPSQDVERSNSVVPQSEAGLTAEILSEEGGVPESGSAAKLIVEEERKTGSVSNSIYKLYFSIFSPGLLLPFMVMLFFSKDIVQLANDAWLSRWSSGGIPVIQTFLIGYIILAGGIFLVSFGRALFVRLRGLKSGTVLHEKLLSGVLKAPLSFFDTNPTGRILSRFSGDIEAVDFSIPTTLIEVLGSFCVITSSIFLILVVNPYLIFIFPFILAANYQYQKLFRPTSREAQRLDSITRSPIFAQYSESLAGLSSIKAFGWRDLFISRLEKAVDSNQRCFYSLVAANRWLGLRIETVGAITVFFAALAPVLISSSFGAAGAGLAVVYAITITGSLNWNIRMLTQLEGNMNSVERIDYYSKTPGEKWDGLTPSNWPIDGNIEFNSLNVRYSDKSQAVLKGITAKIKGGERIGIVGRTGAGKSTIVLALTRLVEPSSGAIFIDGIRNTDLALESLRSAIAVIPQDPVMFLGTLRGNLDPFKQFTDREIWTALKRTHIEDFVKALPQELLTEVHEGGINFSSGQRQLICLARALLRNNKIIVLDEATANVDAQTDSIVQQTVQKEFAGKTILTIAHRVSTILDYDKVMVLDKGQIVEFDSVSTLLAKPKGHFLKMLFNPN